MRRDTASIDWAAPELPLNITLLGSINPWPLGHCGAAVPAEHAGVGGVPEQMGLPLPELHEGVSPFVQDTPEPEQTGLPGPPLQSGLVMYNAPEILGSSASSSKTRTAALNDFSYCMFSIYKSFDIPARLVSPPRSPDTPSMADRVITRLSTGSR